MKLTIIKLILISGIIASAFAGIKYAMLDRFDIVACLLICLVNCVSTFILIILPNKVSKAMRSLASYPVPPIANDARYEPDNEKEIDIETKERLSFERTECGHISFLGEYLNKRRESFEREYMKSLRDNQMFDAIGVAMQKSIEVANHLPTVMKYGKFELRNNSNAIAFMSDSPRKFSLGIYFIYHKQQIVSQ